LPGHQEASVDGGHLLKVIDGIVSGRKQKNSQLVLDISDGRVEWRPLTAAAPKRTRTIQSRSVPRQFIESRFLYHLNRGASRDNETDDDDNQGAIYIGFNRVVGGNFRSGSGLCRATVQLFADSGKSLLALICVTCVNRKI
jgi:hypothetical protein